MLLRRPRLGPHPILRTRLPELSCHALSADAPVTALAARIAHDDPASPQVCLGIWIPLHAGPSKHTTCSADAIRTRSGSKDRIARRTPLSQIYWTSLSLGPIEFPKLLISCSISAILLGLVYSPILNGG